MSVEHHVLAVMCLVQKKELASVPRICILPPRVLAVALHVRCLEAAKEAKKNSTSRRTSGKAMHCTYHGKRTCP